MYSIEQTGYSVRDSSEPQTSNPFLADQTRQQFKVPLKLGPGTPTGLYKTVMVLNKPPKPCITPLLTCPLAGM